MSSQDKQAPAATLKGFSPQQVQDKVCVPSGSPQVAALTLSASAVPHGVVSSSQVLAMLPSRCVLCLLLQVFLLQRY